MHIKELMSHPAVTCPASATLDQAARLMWEYDCGMIPVVNDEGQLTGVVTDRDICMAAYTQGQALSAIAVTTAMAKQVIASHAYDDVESAETLMRDNQIHRVPVLDAGARVEGVISMSDLARAAVHAKKSGTDRALVRTLAAISEPRSRTEPRPVEQIQARPATSLVASC